MSLGQLPVWDQADKGIRLVEEEHRRIARDLHDGPAQQLTAISMKVDIISNMMDRNPEMAKRELQRLNGNVIKTINDIRKLLFDLRPLAVDEVGLVRAIMELADKFNRDENLPVQVTDHHDVTKYISPAKQVALYRLIQEILNNMKKHAEATQLTVDFSLDSEEDSVTIVIQDNGKGFDPDIIPAGHYGLIGMKERAAYLNGQLDIHSEIEVGSRFTVTLPAVQNSTIVRDENDGRESDAS